MSNPARYLERLADQVDAVIEGDPEELRTFVAELDPWSASVLIGALLGRAVLELGAPVVRQQIDGVLEQLGRAAAGRNLDRTDGDA